MRSTWLWVFFWGISIGLLAQNRNTDSLLRLIEQSPNDSLLAIYYEQLAAITTDQAHAEQALHYHRQSGDSIAVGEAYFRLAWPQAKQARYPVATRYLQQSIQISTQYNDSTLLANAHNRLGVVFYYQGLYPQALQEYLLALGIREKRKDAEGVAGVENNIGIIYRNQENYDLALQYHQRSLVVMRQHNNQRGIAHNLNNIATVYYQQKRYDQAEQYHQTALGIWQDLNEIGAMSYSYTGLGDAFFAEKKYTQALQNYQQALRLAQQDHNSRDQAYAYKDIGQTYLAMQDHPRAIATLLQATELAQSVKAVEVSKSAHQLLSDAYAAMGDYRAALDAHRQYKAFSDSLLNESNTRALTQQTADYQFQKEKDALQLLQIKERLAFREESEHKARIQRATLFGLVFLLLLLGFAGIFYANKRRSNRRLTIANTQLTQAYEEARSANEEAQRLLGLLQEKQKNIADSIQYARRIQQAILPTTEQLQAALPEHFVFFRPRDMVSGDLYWMSDLRQKHQKVILAVIDCTGHGVPGAFMSLIANDLLNAIINEQQLHHPALILEQLHREIRRALRQSQTQNRDGMDMALICIDQLRQELCFAGAKLPMVYVQEGVLHTLRGDRMPIGGEQRERSRTFTPQVVSFADAPLSLYLFSDGYQDQFGGKANRKFMGKRLRRTLLHIHDQPMPKQQNHLSETMDDWMQNEAQIDDMLIVGVRLGR
ncbi:MAG: tetratricopeptide repeat protein [Bernardetiaceae bacterium]